MHNFFNASKNTQGKFNGLSVTSLIPLESIHDKVRFLREQRVMLDFDLARLYGVKTKALNQAVKRNIERFPADFMFQLSGEEIEQMMWSQFVTTSQKTRKNRDLPYAFTEQGIAMLSSVLRSEQAVQVNIAIMRAFVQMREAMISHRDLAQKLEEMERKYDSQFRIIFDALRNLTEPPAIPKKPMGFLEKDYPYSHSNQKRENHG